MKVRVRKKMIVEKKKWESSELERDFVIIRVNWNFEDENKERESEKFMKTRRRGKREGGGLKI